MSSPTDTVALLSVDEINNIDLVIKSMTEDWTLDDDDGVGEDFPSPIVPCNTHAIDDGVIDGHDYLDSLDKLSKLVILQSAQVNKAFVKNGPLGFLFTLFLSTSLWKCVMTWTNKTLLSRGKKAMTPEQFQAYIGLEMAMSIVQMNSLKDYWKKEMFCGHSDFQSTVSHDQFLDIRASLSLRDPDTYNHDDASTDPLWHSRKLLEHFQKNIAMIAVPTGTSALDEASLATKARTVASLYLPNKPDKYAIRFYAVVGTDKAYLSSFVDNGSGNTTSESNPEAYCCRHRDLRTPFNKIFKEFLNIDKDSPSALWILQMSHQTKLHPDPSGKRVFDNDNFYTRHILAKCLMKMTDNEARMTGTVKLTNVDSTNWYYLAKAINQLKDIPRGTWLLVRAYNKVPDLEKLRRQHNLQNKTRDDTGENKTTFIPPTELVEEKAGYIVWKDKKAVVFYSNDLASTPTLPILKDDSMEAIMCVYGLTPVKRWTNTKYLHRSTFMVPCMISAYNKQQSYECSRLHGSNAKYKSHEKEGEKITYEYVYVLTGFSNLECIRGIPAVSQKQQQQQDC